MKRILSLLLIFLFLPLTSPAEEAGSAAGDAVEIAVEIRTGNDKPADAEPLRDGSDETGMDLKKGKESSVILILPEDGSCDSVFVRLSAVPDRAELQRQNEKKKWIAVSEQKNPGFQFLSDARGLTGKIRLTLFFPSSVPCRVLELRCFTAGTLPAFAHVWERVPAETEILMAAASPAEMDFPLLTSLLEKGRSVAVALASAEDALPAVCDRLWESGLRTLPLLGAGNSKKPNYANLLAGWIRTCQPLLVLTDATLAPFADSAVTSAADPSWTVNGAPETGIWAVPDTGVFGAEAEEKATHLSERNNSAILAFCQHRFENAQHADPAGIPWPVSRLADGYLPEGEEEFVYDDPEKGLWGYASSTLQVEIVKYQMPEVPHTWFEAHVIFKPEAESFTQHTWVNAIFEGQQIYPETLAQTSKLVFAVNGDYHPNRASKKWPVGNIIRRRKVLYNYDGKGSMKFPNLDTLAIRKDGSFSVYGPTEITADELIRQEDVTDSLSFGPYLVRDGQLRIYRGNSADVPEPRCAYGMVEPGHLFFVMVEGKMPKKGEQGFNLWTLAELMYARGCTEAMNVDGGSTAVMLFMGRKLNRTGKGNSLGSPRNQHELFGIGTSEKVYTDMVAGKKKKK